MWAAEASRGGGCFLSTHWAPSSPPLLASPTLARCEPFIFAAAARMSLLIRNIVQSEVSVVSGQIWRWNTGPLAAERRAREERDVVSRFLSLCVTHYLNLAFLSDCVMISTDRNSAHNHPNVLVAVISIFIAFVGSQIDSN